MNQWQLLSDRFSQLQQREKLLLWGGSLILTLWLVSIYVLEPRWQQVTTSAKQLKTLQRQQQDTQQLAEQLRQQIAVDMDKEYHQRIQLLQQQQFQLNEQIQQTTSHFIDAEQMVQLLQSMLQSSNTLQISRLQSLEPRPVQLAGQTADEPALLYQHTIKLVLAGNYTELSEVLERIEQLPWLVSWQGLGYQVTDYPLAELTLELGTVSENEDFIRL
ncbi:hypothetical protein [Rheinheimera baltica]|uniref:hypothetical protein n=1 Tax=Rheinheimera baltica TaxID=67576 RepID=UPI00273F0A38|nr:hypothetical protein [Rheinheimera baltica]MDP5151901.1 hypothetical protein [Rheinheimera baltica]